MTHNLHVDSVGKSRLIRMVSLALFALACSACSMNLRPEPEVRGQSIAGQWQLQTPPREVLASTLSAVMEQARAKQEKRDRRRYPRGMPPEADATDLEGAAAPQAGGPQGETGADQPFRRNNWEAREQREQQDALLNVVLPSNKLLITQSAGRIEMLPDSGGRRRFDMGISSTLVKSYATFRIESGWQANVFVVHSKDSEQGIDIVERYQRVGDNGLHLQVQVNLPDAKEQLLAADYVLAKP